MTQRWRQEVHASLERQGLASLADLLKSHPGISLTEIGDVLGTGTAPILMVEALKDEVRGRSDAEEWLVADLLARSIRKLCPDGWSTDPAKDFERAHAIGATTASLRDLGPEWPLRLQQIGAELMHRKIEAGWSPLSGADQHLRDAMKLSKP